MNKPMPRHDYFGHVIARKYTADGRLIPLVSDLCSGGEQWRYMVGKCHRRSHNQYKRWGGRGFTVCDRWRDSFATFFEDMGGPPGKNYSVQLIGDATEFGPCVCEWKRSRPGRKPAKRYTIDGETLPLSDWCERHGQCPRRVRGRLKLGWSFERALTEAVREIDCHRMFWKRQNEERKARGMNVRGTKR